MRFDYDEEHMYTIFGLLKGIDIWEIWILTLEWGG